MYDKMGAIRSISNLLKSILLVVIYMDQAGHKSEELEILVICDSRNYAHEFFV
jgi:hypothetical protein